KLGPVANGGVFLGGPSTALLARQMANHVNRSKKRTGGTARKGPRLEVRSQLSDANVAATGGVRVSQMGGQKATSRRVNRMSALPPPESRHRASGYVGGGSEAPDVSQCHAPKES